MALTAVDGSFLDCNWRFERASGYAKADLLRMNFFTLARPAQRDANIFHLVAEMLRGAAQVAGGPSGQCVVRAALHPDRARQQQADAYLHLSTVPEHNGSGPGAVGEVKFFTCALLPSPSSP
jgi:PAS domain-containing protein